MTSSDEEEKSSITTEESCIGVNKMVIHMQTKIFHWMDVCYDTEVRGG
jgi:hypothetical protein